MLALKRRVRLINKNIMENEQTIKEIYRSVGRLEGKIETGFTAINDRLDKLNGSVKNHDDRINVNESKIDNASGAVKMVAVIASFIGAVIGFLLSYFKN